MGFRVDIVAGATTMMAAFIAANPTIIKRHFRSRPPTTNTDIPYTFLDLRPEGIHYVSGLQERVMSPSIVAVFDLADNQQTTDEQDAAVDLLVDHFATYPHLIPGTVWDDMTITDEAVAGDTSVAAVRFGFGNISFRQGRT